MKATLAERKPNGPAAAAILAANIGVFVLGAATTLAEISAPLKDALNLYAPTGPLSGKTTAGVLAWLIAWVALHFYWQRKDVDFSRVFSLSLVLLGLGLLFMFPPFFELFATQ